MTQLKFYKYHGAGNDFVIVDFRVVKIDLSECSIALLVHRQGVGGLRKVFTGVDTIYEVEVIADGNIKI